MELPERMFAVGHEPLGLRVTSYGFIVGINQILEALTTTERETIQGSVFGKFLSLVGKPSFSGRFGRFMMSRMLKTTNTHELWFLFAGKPVRFGLREFAIVTGLQCGKIPAKSKKRLKSNITETPYWPSLFGKLDSVSVEMVIRMMKRKTVTNPHQRLTIAYLAILSSVLLPTAHGHKIVKEYAELIKDLDAFLAYPWGRLAFGMIVSSVRERNEITLSGQTMAIKGFVHAIQLVLVAAVPALLEVPTVIDVEESESEDENQDVVDAEEKKSYIRDSHTKKLHANNNTVVESLIPDDGDIFVNEKEYTWGDGEDDPKVAKMLQMIKDEHEFDNSMFVGGATREDVVRMIKEAKEKTEGKGKHKKGCSGVELPTSQSTVIGEIGGVDAESFAASLVTKFGASLVHLENAVKDTNKGLGDLRSEVREVSQEVKNIKSDVLKAISEFMDKVNKASPPKVNLVDTSSDEDDIQCDSSPDKVDIDDEVQNTPLNGRPNTNANQVNLLTSDDIDIFIGTVLRKLRADQEALFDQEMEGTSLMPNGTTSVVGDTSRPGSNENSPGTEVYFVHRRYVYWTPSFSLGLSHEDLPSMDVDMETGAGGDKGADEDTARDEDNKTDEEMIAANEDKEPDHQPPFELEHRHSKRQRHLPHTLACSEFICNKQTLLRSRDAQLASVGKRRCEEYVEKYKKLEEKLDKDGELTINGWTISNKEFIDIADMVKTPPTKIVDVLIDHVRLVLCAEESQFYKKMDFFDSQFPTMLIRNKSKFSRLSDKHDHVFPPSVMQLFDGENIKNLEAERFYFPYNFEKIHWVGICLDCAASTLYVLDCDHAMRKEVDIVKELNTIAQLVPYLLKKVGRFRESQDPKPFAVVRPKSIPQNGRHAMTALSSILLMEAHAIGGVDLCRCITPDILEGEAKRISVMLYESNYQPL